MKNLIKNNAIDAVLDTVQETGILVYLVGGTVRDLIQNCDKNNDLDFVVSESLNHFTAEFSKKVKGKIIVWDENDRRVVFREDGQFKHVDFAGLNGKSIQEDLTLRDITVNAVGIDVNLINDFCLNNLIDPLNGINDLNEKIIRACSINSFNNDPLRILRALRFSRKYGYTIESSTYTLMKASADQILSVSAERIKNEFFTVLNYKDPKISVEQMIDIGFIDRFIPEIINFKSIKQGAKHKYDLFDHSLVTVSRLERAEDELTKRLDGNENLFNSNLNELIEEGVTRRSLLVFSALLHDSGKAQTAMVKDNCITFYGHEKAGMDINRKLSKRAGLGKNAQNIVVDLTRNHMRLLHLSLLKDLTVRAVKRFIFDTRHIFYELLNLSIADAMATGIMLI